MQGNRQPGGGGGPSLALFQFNYVTCVQESGVQETEENEREREESIEKKGHEMRGRGGELGERL